MKILIIEDDPKNLDGLTRLVRAGWRLEVELEIIGVTTLAQGLEEASDANLTILDLSLPDSDLLSTIRSIRNFPPPVIVLTGSDDPDVAAACIAHGASHVFVKGSMIGFMGNVFEGLQKDILRRAAQPEPPVHGP